MNSRKRGGRGFRGSGFGRKVFKNNPNNPSGHRGTYRGGNFRRPNGNFHNRHNNSSRDNQQFPQYNAEVLEESAIGVTEYISSLTGFNGILKARYSDFHVNEIDLDGNIAKLTDLSIPEDPAKNLDEDDEDLMDRYCYEHLPIEVWDQLHAMIQNPDKSPAPVQIDVSSKTKEERTKIHESVKLVFGAKIVGSTVELDGVKYISFMKYNKNVRVDRREKWPKERDGEYVHFLVYKEHYDTMEATMRIAEALRMKPSMLSYAGTKDRRAITTQWFSVKRVEPRKLSEICKLLHNIRIGNFCFKKTVLKLGSLKGNRFRIALRNVTASDELINEAVSFLKSNGFLNYYGLQRFGNSAEVPTYEVGKQLLKGNWKEACALILMPRKFETDRMIGNAKKIYLETGDAQQALHAFGSNRDRTIEGKLFQGLQKHHENDLVNALEFVPRNMRLLYIHAYQSLIWNKVLSRRVKEFGLKPILGDLVLPNPEEINELENLEEVNLDTKAEDEVVPETANKLVEDRKDTKVNVKVLTEEDLPNYTIYDIVLPLPGFGIQYPNNVLREWYQEFLEVDGLELEMSKLKVKTYRVSGSYRKCVEKADKLSWKIMKYKDPLQAVIRSDFEELRNKPEPESIEDGPYKALVLDFCLPSASYATMALREVLKTDTSTAAHAKLNNYHSEAKRKNDELIDGECKKIKTEDELGESNNQGLNNSTEVQFVNTDVKIKTENLDTQNLNNSIDQPKMEVTD